MLELMKLLLNIELYDISKDDLLNHFINRAIKAALTYCNVTELPPEHDDTIADLAVYFYKNRDSLGYNHRYKEKEVSRLKAGVFLNLLNQLYRFPGSRSGVEDV